MDNFRTISNMNIITSDLFIKLAKALERKGYDIRSFLDFKLERCQSHYHLENVAKSEFLNIDFNELK